MQGRTMYTNIHSLFRALQACGQRNLSWYEKTFWPTVDTWLRYLQGDKYTVYKVGPGNFDYFDSFDPIEEIVVSYISLTKGLFSCTVWAIMYSQHVTNFIESVICKNSGTATTQWLPFTEETIRPYQRGKHAASQFNGVTSNACDTCEL